MTLSLSHSSSSFIVQISESAQQLNSIFTDHVVEFLIDKKPESITFAMNPPGDNETTLTAAVNETPSPTTNEQAYMISPTGEVVAFQKSPFDWKQFNIGAGIPIMIMLIPIILMAVFGEDQYGYNEENATLSKTGDGTAYIGQIDIGLDDELLGCWIYDGGDGQSGIARCEGGDDDYVVELQSRNEERNWEITGYFNLQNGTVYFDDESSYSETLLLYYDYETEEELADYERTVFFEELFFVACWVSPLSAVVVSIVGYTKGNNSMGTGGITGLCLYPLLSLFALLFFVL
ncbi:MAG: hypothetical protein CMP10_14370 [Zetaproteobacteria bacterium]|nr:hypothetical protein [Pseudobdellovibrionaceae bacterium]